MKNKKIISICAIVAILAIAFLSTVLSLSKNTNNSNNDPYVPPADEFSFLTETINDINWSVKYNYTKGCIDSISSSYHEYDKSSKYWKEIARQHGDSSLWVDYNVTLTGTPIGDDWFRIEKLEIYSFNNETLSCRTTRIEEKIIFSVLP